MLSLHRSRSAQEYFARAIRVFERNPHMIGFALALSSIGRYYRNGGQHAEALPYLERSLHCYEQLGGKWSIADVLIEIGLVHAKMNNPREALEAYHRSYAVVDSLGDRATMARVLLRMGEFHIQLGQCRKAIGRLTECREIAEEIGDVWIHSSSLRWIGSCLMGEGRYTDALNSLWKSLGLMQENGSIIGVMNTLLQIGAYHYSTGRYGEALPFFERCDSICARYGLRKERISPLQYISALHSLYLGQPETALEAQKEIERINEEIGETHDLAMTLHAEANLLERLNRPEELLSVARRGRELALQSGDSLLSAAMEAAIGQADLKMGLYDDALLSFQSALRIKERTPDPSTVDLLISISLVLSELRRNEDALPHLRRARDMAVTFGQDVRLAESEYALGEVYRSLERYDEALECYYRCLKLSEDKNLPGELCLALLGIGHVYLCREQSDKAMVLVQRSKTIAEEHGLKQHLSLSLGALGEVEAMQAAPDAALKHQLKALTVSREIRDIQLQLLQLKCISDLYKSKNDWKLAYASLEQYTALSDSLRSEKTAAVVAGLNARYESERKDNEIALLEKEKSMTALALQQQKDSLALQDLELARRQTETEVRRLTEIHLRQQASLIIREHEVEGLELARRTAERNAEQAEHAAAEARLQTVTKEKLYQGSVAARERALRNVLLGGLGLVLVIGFLGIKRIQSRRIEASLRAEAAEYQAKVVEAQALALAAESERREKEAHQIFSRQLIDFQEKERERLSSELHDSLSQDLIVIKNRAQMAKARSEDPARARADIGEVIATAASALSEVRQITRDLRPYQVDQIGLAATLRGMLQKVAESSTVRFTVEIDEIDRLLAKDDEIKIYRLVQESVNNILKHAEATEASVRLQRINGSIQLHVRDNGKGFNTGESAMRNPGAAGLGLRSMTERVQMLGGDMHIESGPGHGTNIDIDLPVRS